LDSLIDTVSSLCAYEFQFKIKKYQGRYSIYYILRAEEQVIKRNVKAKDNWCKEKCQRKQEQLLLNMYKTMAFTEVSGKVGECVTKEI
jgi:hypothetical protein